MQWSIGVKLRVSRVGTDAASWYSGSTTA